MSGIKYIIGVDPSLRNTGVSVHDNTGRMIETFAIVTPKGMSDHNSCDRIVQEFFSRLERYLTPSLTKQRATVFFFEDTIYTGGGRAAQGATAGRFKTMGVIEYLLRLDNVPIYAVAPSSMTSFLLGTAPRKSKEKKKAVIDWLHSNRNFYTTNDNEADAYGLAEFGYAVAIEGQKLTYRSLSVNPRPFR